MGLTLALISGCLGSEDGTTPPNGGITTPGPGGNVTLPQWRFEGCDGANFGLHIPEEQAKSHVPAAFNPSSFAPLMGQLIGDAWLCERVVLHDRVVEKASFILTSMAVNPRNGSWEDKGLSFYSYDLLVSDPAIAGALRQAGMSARAANFTSDPKPLGPGVVEENWNYQASDLGIRFSFQHAVEKPNIEDIPVRLHFWFGSETFARADVEQIQKLYDEAAATTGSGILEFDGSSRFKDIIGQATVPVGTAPAHSRTWSIAPKPVLFTTDQTMEE